MSLCSLCVIETGQPALVVAHQYMSLLKSALRSQNQHLVDATNRISELEQENAALREDKERLDLLNTLQWHGGAVTSPMMDGTCFRIQVGARPIIKGNTIRAAIDAARARKKA